MGMGKLVMRALYLVISVSIVFLIVRFFEPCRSPFDLFLLFLMAKLFASAFSSTN